MCSCVSSSLSTSLVIWDEVPVCIVSTYRYFWSILALTPWTYAVNVYSVGCTIQRDRFRHVDNGTSRGTVTSEIARSYQTEDARNIYDPAAISVWVWILIEHLP